jgi:hypothetical protein
LILADSSIWVDHFRRADPETQRLLANHRVLSHPFVIAEIALGSLAERRTKLHFMELLLQVKVADTAEVRRLIDTRALHSRGIGFVDAHLLASCLLTGGTELWTRDRRLNLAAQFIGVSTYSPSWP